MLLFFKAKVSLCSLAGLRLSFWKKKKKQGVFKKFSQPLQKAALFPFGVSKYSFTELFIFSVMRVKEKMIASFVVTEVSVRGKGTEVKL